MRERPNPAWPRRLADWIKPEGAGKVHSLVDKVYSKRNLAMAWERVRRNAGSGGIDGQSIGDFAAVAEEELERLHQELKAGKYEPRAVRQQLIPKAGQPGKMRPLGIPTVYDRVCQQAVLNRLEGIFEPVFDEANFGYRMGKSAKGALRKIWGEIEEGGEWIVDADLKDFFGSVNRREASNLGQSTCRRWARHWVNRANAPSRSQCGRKNPKESARHTAGRSHLPPAK